MSDIARRTVAELRARYEFEPQLEDVFVEGAFDREVLSEAQRNVATAKTIYEIDTVDVPDEILRKYGLTSGNKQRVLALAQELSPVAKDAKYLCLVDKDLDHWFGDLENISRLKWSSYCSIELHFFSESALRDILLTTGQAKVSDFKHFESSMTRVLRDLYLLRLVDRQLSLACRWVALKKYLSCNQGNIEFDRDKYILAVLNANSSAARYADFCNAFAAWDGQVSGDCRDHIRGHDYVFLLAWAVKEFGGNDEFASETSVERVFVILSRELDSLRAEIEP